MAHFPYLIVGGGMAADAAAQAIRKINAGVDIAMISAEKDAPYNRPPLSKGLWRDQKLDDIDRRTTRLGIDLLLGRAVVGIEPAAHRVTDDRGTEYTYGKLLLATGAEPRRLDTDDPRVIHYRTAEDYRRLRELATEGARAVVIGGGFIGSELAAALALNHVRTTMIFPDEGICGRLLPRELAVFMAEFYRRQGIEMFAGTKVQSVESLPDGKILIHTNSGRIEADVVVAGIGVTPRVKLAADAGLEVGNGIMVNSRLRTSAPDVYAAGDVALFFNPALGTQLRVEHEDNANTMGETAGRAMAGEDIHYTHLPSFYSDLFTHGYEAIGETDARLDTVADWKEPNQEGMIYYLRDGRLRGVLTWNIFGKMDEARRALEDKRLYTRPEELKGRI